MIGRVIDHYRITEKLGEGGMGIVYRARDEHLPREVAIKVIASAKVGDDNARLRFRNEAFSLARLNHANIGTIFDYVSQDGREFIVMECVPGVTLHSKLKGTGLPMKEVARLGVQLADGLAAAHEKGVVHRDLKPGNIMITPDGRLKILDFGLAMLLRQADISSQMKTPDPDMPAQPAPSGGTPPYMAPEQLSGEQEDERTDLYAAGNVLYEMATGQRPFVKGRALRNDILYSLPRPPSQLEASLSSRFDEIVLKCLEKDPGDRYQTAKDLQVDLRRLAAKKPPAPNENHSRIRAVVKWGAIALACLAGAAGIYRYWQSAQSDEPPRFKQWGVAAGEPSEREPAISPDGMKIVYIQLDRSSSRLCLIPHNGSMPRVLKESNAEYADPAWFPSSNYIAYAVYQDGKWRIFGTAESGQEESMLVENARHPAISPDGRHIAFTHMLPDGKRRIGVASLAGTAVISDITMLTGDQDGPANHTDPAWSGDSDQICYRTGKGLWVIPAGGGKSRHLTEMLDNDPVWSPGGRYIYYSSGREGSAAAIWRVKTDGSRTQRITTGPGPASHPSISWDGVRLAYSSEGTDYSLFLVDTSSGQDTQLVRFRGARVAALSPRGDKIAVVMPKGNLGFYCIYIQDIEQGKPKPTTLRVVGEEGSTPTFPTFSPDSKYLAYSWSSGKDLDLWTVSTEGGTPYHLLEHPAKQQHPAWSPEGSQIAYISAEKGRNELCLLPVKDGKRSGSVTTLDTQGVEPWWPAWSADGEKIAFLGRRISDTRGEEFAIWVITVRGKTQVRQLTARDANVLHAHWLADTSDLLVSGLWGGDQFTLRRISSVDRKILPGEPHILFGQDAAIGHFDVSRDGRWLLYLREQKLRGSIFLHEAYDGKY